MITLQKAFPLALLLCLLTPALNAQTYSVSWYKIAGGGGASAGTNGGTVYSVNSTIGQSDAGGAINGGGYSVTGGFWSLIAVVQTKDLPSLSIAHAGNSVIVSWPNTGGYNLQLNSNLSALAGWAASGYSVITNANGTNSITITPPTGSLFFRLANP
jgi:hypothetical protein